MSTFDGLIREFPGVSVDRFDGKNIFSLLYFLSHCHSDHMEGLSENFFKTLNESKRYLYCSSLSKRFLENKYKLTDSDVVREIRIDDPMLINYKENETIAVTGIAAGHCPGSVMFLFEKDDQSVLYTGDFRINSSDYPKLRPLHHIMNSKRFPKTLNKVYLDTTFLNKDFQFLPTREASLERICIESQKWLDKHPKNVIILEISANYGSEYLFLELSKHFGMKIHVKYFQYTDYQCLSELRECVTLDNQTTRIHACKGKREQFKCLADLDSQHILKIVPSVQRWQGKDAMKLWEWDEMKDILYVCYSTHQSYDELRSFIDYFNIKNIYPSVIAQNMKEKIDSLLIELKDRSIDRKRSIDTSCPYKLTLPKFKRMKNKIGNRSLSK